MRAWPSRWWLLVVGVLVAVLGLVAAVTILVVPTPDPAAPVGAGAVARPVPTRTPLLADPGDGAPLPSAAGLARALAPALADPALGGAVALSVVDATTRQVLLERSAATGAVPASTIKIATAVAALSVLPVDSRFTTRVVAGSRPGEVVLVGGGDPLLAGKHPLRGYPGAARLADLAAVLLKAGVPVRRVLVDDSLFAGPRLGPGWKAGYVGGGDVAPVSALSVDGGRAARGEHAARVADPALEAGRQLAGLLGVQTPVTRTVAAPGAAPLATVRSPPVAQVVEAMLGRSDNDVAESFGRHIALARGLPATFDGEAQAVADVVSALVGPGGRPVLRDTSGLSPLDRVAPAALTRLLATAAPDARFGPLLSGLPIAGFDGTLTKRYRSGPAAAAAGLVRAKTGTLSGVGALAGFVRTRGGRLLAFDLTANGVPANGTTAAQGALDRVAAVLAGCGCQ